jgi:hypothetical protein
MLPSPSARKRVVSIFILLLTCSITLPAHAVGPGADVFVGYSHLFSNTFYPNSGGLNGWTGAMHVKLKPFFGIEGDLSHYGFGANASVPRTTTFLGGPRVTLGAAGIKVFVHALAGGEHSANSSGPPISGTALAVAVGGGADVRFAPFFSWRVGVDYLNAPTQSPGSGTHARFNTGLVFRF